MNITKCFGKRSRTVPADDHIGVLDNTTRDKPPPPCTSRRTTAAYACRMHFILLEDINAPEFRGTRATGSSNGVGSRTTLEVPWKAELRIRAKDLPQLFRRGLLFWSEDNFDALESFISPDKPPRQDKVMIDWQYYRSYAIADISPDPTWTGELCVYAKTGIFYNLSNRKVSPRQTFDMRTRGTPRITRSTVTIACMPSAISTPYPATCRCLAGCHGPKQGQLIRKHKSTADENILCDSTSLWWENIVVEGVVQGKERRRVARRDDYYLSRNS